jgi:uncharacterized membrane protein
METIPPTIPPTTSPSAVSGEDKTAAIVSYLTLIGFIVALVLNSSKKTKLGAYHLRQSLGLLLTAIAVSFALGIMLMVIGFVVHFLALLLSPLLYLAFGLAMLTLWIMGLIAAINGEMKPVPVVGPLYQKWFGTAFE